MYEGALETDAMSAFIADAPRSENEIPPGKANKSTTPLTRLPTVMTRKESKVKSSPPPLRPDPAAAGAAGGGAEASGEGGASEGGAGRYAGMNKEQILEQFRARQAEREAVRRKAMDAEVRSTGFIGYEVDFAKKLRGEDVLGGNGVRTSTTDGGWRVLSGVDIGVVCCPFIRKSAFMDTSFAILECFWHTI